MNQYILNLEMTTNSAEHAVAFERIRYFIYNQIENSIFIDNKEKDQCQHLINAGLQITTLPGPPYDQLVGVMMYYKLNAIMEDHIVLHQTEISSSLGENIRYLHSEMENINIEPIPKWWTLSDLTHADSDLINSEKIVTLKSSNWNELDLNWTNSSSTESSGNTVVFPLRNDHETK